MRSNKRLNLLFMIAVLAALAYGARYILQKRKEGFESAVKCPTDYTFFTDKHGDSLCCQQGMVDPYTHTCKSSRPDGMCAFKPGVRDPRHAGRTLAECGKLRDAQYRSRVQTFCPTKLPHYASSGKCCMTGLDTNGAECAAADAADKSRYCVGAGGAAGEQRCEELKLFDATVCPGNLQKTLESLSSASNVKTPLCRNFRDVCIPDPALSYVQKHGMFTNKRPDTWIYACNKWKKYYIDRDTTGETDMSER